MIPLEKCTNIKFHIFSVSDTIAFHSALTSYSTIPDESRVIFNEVIFNEEMGVYCYLVYYDKNSIVKLVLFLIFMLMKSNLFHQVICSYNSTTGVFTVPLVEIESTTSLPMLFISSYDSTTGVFTVPLGGDRVYYFSTYLIYLQL